MGDTENALPPSKKRVAGRQISRENPGLDDEETSEQEMGTFKKASDDVMAKRKIVKVRRHQTSAAPSSNPFSSICLVSPVGSNTTTPNVNSEIEMPVKDNIETVNEQQAECKNDTSVEENTDAVNEKGNSENVDIKNDSVSVSENTEAFNEKGHSEKVEDKNDLNEETDKEKDGGYSDKLVESRIDEPGPELTEKNEGNDAATAEKTDKFDQANVETVEAESLNETKKDAKDEGVDGCREAHGNENVEKNKGTVSFSSFKQLSSNQNAFSGFAGTGFSGSPFSFGLDKKDGSSSGSGTGVGSLFGLKNDQSFGFGVSNNGNSSLFGTSETLASVKKSEGSRLPSMREVPVETGEENEKAVFTADSVLFEFLDGSWKERGKGEVKVNVSTTGTEKARLVMRARGNYRLILNASLYADMSLTNMDKKGVTFACVNSIGEACGGLSTFALKFKDASIVEEFRVLVTEYKGKTAVALKTPENSPKAVDD